ncbi:Lar family restriction alleviation protein [Actimicrobium sp. CCC2.4]|uniref:Lar family restriction alleviation protein n=1 Tax=Actimicrobium sp. CCC2.4 TaxID=3048606 RepID=UPI002AC8B9A8|nr:Lar family restriction alleviation protein [Actimicrobium sp. CCC2.4]MEB0133819.1 Lar family restriction alleviation protein [Actimicrobium sp. CCC2.4]WPX31361.1 Lar family restriction alleviation protein [Actimicrobium sp. CCC2.4]
MSELLACPFCDADHQSVGYNISEMVIECGCCGAIGPDTMFGANNRASAIAAWNTRVEPADLTDEQIVKIITDANLNFECIWPIPISRDGVMFYVSREASLGIHGDILKIARLFLRERQ